MPWQEDARLCPGADRELGQPTLRPGQGTRCPPQPRQDPRSPLQVWPGHRARPARGWQVNVSLFLSLPLLGLLFLPSG